MNMRTKFITLEVVQAGKKKQFAHVRRKKKVIFLHTLFVEKESPRV